MKITQTNDTELTILNSGTAGLIGGGTLLLIGIGIGVYPLIGTAEWWVSLIGAAVAGFGGLLIFTAATVTTTLRRGGTSTISERRLVGGRLKEASFESSQVDHIKLESHTEYSSSSSSNRSGQQNRRRVSEVFAELKDGTEISLATQSANANGGVSLNGISVGAVMKAPLSKEAKQIADFLGVPLKTGLQDASLQDVVGVVQTAFGHSTSPATTSRPAASAETPEATTKTQS